MPAADELRTERLLLRRWRAADGVAMAAINRDPEVARFLNRPRADGAFVRALEAEWRRRGYGLWALESTELVSTGDLLGFAGLSHPSFLPALEFEVEIGWRLARSAWGRGLASEAARAVMDHARAELGLRRLVSIIHPENERSRRVAEKLGMAVGRRVHNPVLGIPVEVWEVAL